MAGAFNKHAETTRVVGANVRALREERGLSLRELATMVGVDEEVLASAEEGVCCVEAPELYKISVALNISLERFFRMPQAISAFLN